MRSRALYIFRIPPLQSRKKHVRIYSSLAEVLFRIGAKAHLHDSGKDSLRKSCILKFLTIGGV